MTTPRQAEQLTNAARRGRPKTAALGGRKAREATRTAVVRMEAARITVPADVALPDDKQRG